MIFIAAVLEILSAKVNIFNQIWKSDVNKGSQIADKGTLSTITASVGGMPWHWGTLMLGPLKTGWLSWCCHLQKKWILLPHFHPLPASFQISWWVHDTSQLYVAYLHLGVFETGKENILHFHLLYWEVVSNFIKESVSRYFSRYKVVQVMSTTSKQKTNLTTCSILKIFAKNISSFFS